MLTSVAGTVFSDTNRNGVLNTGEAKLASRTVFADYNYNSRVDAGEPSTISNASGAYTLTTRATNVSVRLVANAGESVSLPYSATSIWLPTVTGALTGKNIGVVASAGSYAAHFRVYTDYNANGHLDAGEQTSLAPTTGFSGWLDLDGNATQNSAGGEKSILDFDGALLEDFSIFDLAPGAYRFKLKANRAGTSLTTSAAPTITIANGDVTVDVGISGIGQMPWVVLFSDVNRNGVQDTGETTLNASWAGRSLFLDRNNDGVRQANEDLLKLDALGPQTTNTGSFKLAGLQAGETFTTPAAIDVAAGSQTKTIIFGVHLSSTSIVNGAVFADTNHNGKLDTGETRLQNRTVFADYNFNGRLDAGEAFTVSDGTGNYSLATRATNVSLRVRLNIGESISLPYGSTSIWLPSVVGTVTGKNIGIFA